MGEAAAHAIRTIVEAIHSSPTQAVVYGGPSLALGWLTSVPGASNTLLEAVIPYSRISTVQLLGRVPSQYCSQGIAKEMALLAYNRALKLCKPGYPVLGVGFTGTLATSRPKRGDHRFFLSLRASDRIWETSVTLTKNLRSREEEDKVSSCVMIQAMAKACHSSNSHVARPEWLIGKLCRKGRIVEARKLFDGLPERDVITWTDMITGYIKLGNMREARQLFDRADSRKNVVTWTAMVSGYLRSKQLSVAEILFQEMPERNIVSWNTMIDGYAQSGRIDKALELFDEMPERNTVSWNTMIKALVQRARIEEAMILFERMPKRDVISWTAMVDGLAKNGEVDEARRVFDCMPERNIISWNAMVTGYAHNNRVHEADQLFQLMPQRDFASWNTMITGFIRNGEINRACELFDRMSKKNVISWTTMITGFVQNKENEEALKVFSKMLRDGYVKPNVGTYVSILSACSDLASLVEGQQLHQLISKSVHQKNELVTSALINMYSKSGELVAARKIFDDGLVSQRDLISWNSMIAVYAHHGHGKEAIELYDQMRKHGFRPNEVTYLSLLSACSHAGLVEKGMKFFEELVRDDSLVVREDHCTCLVDLYGRAGRLKDVLKLMNSEEARPSKSNYGALLSACNFHGEVSIAKEVVKKVEETGLDDAGTYVMMSNIYAASGKTKEAAEMRMKIKKKGLKKQPGCSWIMVGKQTHVFVVGDRSHPQFEAIDSVVSNLNSKMRKNKNLTSEREEDEFLAICIPDSLVPIPV